MEGRVLSVHRSHLLQARLGAVRFREEFERALAARGPVELEPSERLGLRNMYAYDDEPTRRFKTLLNFELPYAVLDAVLRQLTEAFIGSDAEIAAQLYMTADDLRRCQDSGLQIGAHGHQHRVHSRLTDEEQREEMHRSADYFGGTFGLRGMPWSYPWGFAGSWTATTKVLLEASGFTSAVTMVRAIVKPSDLNARWELPRFDVRDVFDQKGALKGENIRALFSAD